MNAQLNRAAGLLRFACAQKGGGSPRVIHVCFALAKAPINVVDFVFAGLSAQAQGTVTVKTIQV